MDRLSYIAKAVVNIMLSVVGILLGLRFLLKLFSANPANDFVNWIYASSGEILGPFRNVFPQQNIDGSIIEFSTIFALLIYMILGMLAFYVIDLMTPTEEKVKTEREARR